MKSADYLGQPARQVLISMKIFGVWSKIAFANGETLTNVHIMKN